MSTLRVSMAGTVVTVLLLVAGGVGASGQDTTTTPVSGLFRGWTYWVPGPECEAGVTTTADGKGDTTLGRALIHSEHCPSTTEAPHSGELRLYFDDASTLTASYQITCAMALPEGPSVLRCTGVGGQVTGGTGRFEGATGELTFDSAVMWFPGEFPLSGIDWLGTIAGSVSMAPTAAASAGPEASPSPAG